MRRLNLRGVKPMHEVTIWRHANPDRSRELRLADGARRRLRLRAWLDEKKSGPCADCGRCFPPECMDFDHLNGPSPIRVNIGHQKPIPVLEKELANCELVCACCHRIRSRKRYWQKRALKEVQAS
jgi:hypothetical protein